MLISTRGRYALRILTDMAERQSEGFLSVRELAQKQGISDKYLESIIQLLVRGNILTAARGKFGGYRLARPPEQITAWDVFSLTEGSMAAVGCQREDARPCERSPECRALPLWLGLDQLIRDYLSRYTIASLTRQSGETE